MRAMQVVTLGHPLEICEVARPEPGPGQVLLRHHAVGLNFGDLLLIKGSYQEKPALPFTLGMEICGTVEACGDGVTSPKPGTRVAVYAGLGGLAEYGAFDAAHCVPLPDAMSAEDAAAFLVAYGTSHVGLDHRARLRPGERLVVLGAAGGIGLTAVELGKLMGAEVVAVARGAQKLQICQTAGADHLIDAEDPELRQKIKALGGADVVYDPVGGRLFEETLRACNPEARILPLGFASGKIPQIPANIILVKNIAVIGYYWGGYVKFRPEVLLDSFRTLFGWYAEGRLKPHVSHALPLEDANAALDLLRTRKVTGKVVVTIA